MKAISLLQPWASLVAIGAKKIETRSWDAKYRGPLAIHASKGFPKVVKELCWGEPFRSTLLKHGYLMSFCNMPFGAIVATCRLVDCKQIQITVKDDKICNPQNLSVKERAFGNYTPFRYAWILEDIKPLPEPIPAKGHQGLWNWEPPEGVQYG
jgi:hypothetical protein